jgi:hypothetical protein
MLTFGVSSYSHEFEPEGRLTIKCGPSRNNEYEQQKLHPFDFFFIDTDSKGRFIVWTNNYQYPSFDVVKYYSIYNQVGGLMSSKLERYGSIDKYYLFRKEDKSLETRVLMIDKSTMTFISRIGEYVPIMGICWYPSKKE